MIRRPPKSTRTDTLFPYTTLFRSNHFWGSQHNMLSIIAFLGGAAIGVGLAAYYAGGEKKRFELLAKEWRSIAENAVSELHLLKAKRSDAPRWDERRVGKECVST